MIIKNIIDLSSKKISQNTIIEYSCTQCGKKVIKKALALYRNPELLCRQCLSLKKYGATSNRGRTEVKEKVEKTCQEKYGTMSPLSSRAVKEKAKKTMIKKYGAAYTLCSKELKEKTKSTMKERYNVEYALQSKELYKKVKQTKKELYNNENYNNREKAKATCLRIYNEDHPLKNKKIQEKVRKTCLQKYSRLSTFDVEKTKTTKKERYNDERYNNWQQAQLTCMKKYGVKSPAQFPLFMQKIITSCGNSNTSIERKFKEFLNVHNINYTQSYSLNKHIFDFAIFTKDNVLDILVDCDGSYWHCRKGNDFAYKVEKDLVDYRDSNRTQSIPENVKFVIIPEENFEEGIRQFTNAMGLDYDTYIQSVFDWIITQPFPYYHLYYDKNKLKLNNTAIRYFHKSIWHAHKRNLLSPYKAWFNKDIMLKLIKNRFIYIDTLSPDKLLAGLTIIKLAPRVSLFSATLAESLIKEYLNEYNNVFDPCSGFSGRLIGAIKNNKNYLGYDIHKEHVKESNELIKHFKLEQKAQVLCKDSLKEKNSFDCLFTCPPYGNKETYNNESQILSADDWIDVCLQNYKCEKYLFVVDKTEKYRKNIVKEITNKSHFNENKEYVLLF
jgi:16S rRNA G966 N2-methylase RsmD